MRNASARRSEALSSDVSQLEDQSHALKERNEALDASARKQGVAARSADEAAAALETKLVQYSETIMHLKEDLSSKEHV
eukprot:341441-Chlamydomonas_euryale.AAC.1